MDGLPLRGTLRSLSPRTALGSFVMSRNGRAVALMDKQLRLVSETSVRVLVRRNKECLLYTTFE